MSRPVFISYARRASSLAAQALAQRLGADAFLDTTDIDAGEAIGAGVVDALLGARVVVVFSSSAYFTRWYCLRELSVALASFNALVDRAAPATQRNASLEAVVVVLGPEPAGVLDRLPPLLRGTNWLSADDTEGLADLVTRRLSTVSETLAERLDALGELEAVRATVLQETALPPPLALGGVPRFALPGELRVSIGDAFVGRADELWRIHHELSTMRGDASATALTGALEGGGGFGKTRLATEYVHRFGPSAYPGACSGSTPSWAIVSTSNCTAFWPPSIPPPRASWPCARRAGTSPPSWPPCCRPERGRPCSTWSTTSPSQGPANHRGPSPPGVRPWGRWRCW